MFYRSAVLPQFLTWGYQVGISAIGVLVSEVQALTRYKTSQSRLGILHPEHLDTLKMKNIDQKTLLAVTNAVAELPLS